jgi:hypothetical protein
MDGEQVLESDEQGCKEQDEERVSKGNRGLTAERRELLNEITLS